jgi:condensin complex subunit 1
MPDIVSRLSDPANEIEEDKFKEIMKYIIGLIDKDKHSESLVRKTKPFHKAFSFS